jgi:hypothetical protein
MNGRMRVVALFSGSVAGTILAVVLAAACSTSSGGAAASDAGAGECGKIDSACGQPCEPGNELGIGRFCNTLHDCDGTQIPTICATLGDPTEHFCTAMCLTADAGDEAGAFPRDCGQGATCQCQGSQCGCFPTSCF